MCIAPITIKNPYYKLGNVGLNSFHDTVDSHIQVPCGNCVQCISMRQSFFLQRVQMESLRSYLFMFTLTYNNESLIYADVGEYHLAVPNFSDVQNMFKRLRNAGHKFRFTYCSEYGKLHHRPHFHGIIALDHSLGNPRRLEKQWHKLLSSEWRRNYSNVKRCPDYRPLFSPVFDRHRLTTFDLHYIEPVINHDNDCAYYVSKYITKYDSWTQKLLGKIATDPDLDPEEMIYIYKLVKPRCNTSKDFGSWKDPIINAYINKCAHTKSNYRYPQFVDIFTGKRFAMSPYYGKHIAGFEHSYDRLLNSSCVDAMSTNYDDYSTILELEIERQHALLNQQVFEQKLKKMEKRFDF